MTKISTAVRSALAVTACALPFAALATDGYFSHGYGMKGKGMGGATVSLALDGFAGANNPAASAFAGGRIDVGVDWFSPQRKATRSGSGGGMLDYTLRKRQHELLHPRVRLQHGALEPALVRHRRLWQRGHEHRLPEHAAQLLAVRRPAAGQRPVRPGAPGRGPRRSSSSRRRSPGRLLPEHAIGISPLFAYQRFEAVGIQLFTQLSQAPGNVTNQGYDSSTGWGARFGYMGKFGSGVAVGASYTTKMSMGEFDKYKGLFAENGGFDIPAHYALGVSFEPAKNWLVALDWMRIEYSGVKSIGNPSTNQAPLGSADGPGFGWQDVDVWKLGVQYVASPTLTLRAGYNRSDNPITPRDVTFNILAPGVIKDHLSVGFTYALDKDSEITMAYTHAFENSVEGASFFNAFAPGMGGTEKIEMYQNSLGIAWAKRW